MDAGNNNYINTSTLDQANFWPYGETFFHFPTDRFSNGRLIPDFIAEYAKLPILPPYLQPGLEAHQYYNVGLNFASAGAGALLQTFQGSVISLKTQLQYHKKVENEMIKKFGSVEAEITFSTTVYMLSIGTDDYISPFLTNSSILSFYSHIEYVQFVIGNL